MTRQPFQNQRGCLDKDQAVADAIEQAQRRKGFHRFGLGLRQRCHDVQHQCPRQAATYLRDLMPAQGE